MLSLAPKRGLELSKLAVTDLIALLQYDRRMVCPLFANAFYGFSSKWICEIKATICQQQFIRF